jgi:nitrate/nitrite transporter NarK
MGLDPTCRLCDPFNDDESAGCGGIGPNYVETWTINGSLSMKEAGFDSELVGLSSSDISVANLAGVLGAIVIRVIVGPISDQIGLRLSYSALLVVAAVPGFCLCGQSTSFFFHLHK